tara:strand:- start:4766 stop:5068 length:303 start_codon:yes stop_codon:yes gene_type:complete
MTDQEDRRAIDQRIVRVENKIDSLIEAVTELVRVEVTLQTMGDRLNNHSEAIKSMDARIDTIEVKVPIYDLSTSIIKRVGAIALTILVTGIIGSVLVFSQ